MLICQKFQELGIKYSMPHIHGRGVTGADPNDGAEAAQTLETTRPYLGQPVSPWIRPRIRLQADSEILLASGLYMGMAPLALVPLA